MVIGLIAGVLVVFSVFFWENRGVDDPVGAVSVHGVCGIFGLLSVGIFGDGTYGAGWNGVGASDYLGVAGRGVTGFLYGDWSQFFAQCIGALVCMTWAFCSAFVFFKIDRKNDVLYVPSEAIGESGANLQVTVVDQGRQVTRNVQVGLNGNDTCEIISGLQEGDTVVIKDEETKTTSNRGGPGGPPPF